MCPMETCLHLRSSVIPYFPWLLISWTSKMLSLFSSLVPSVSSTWKAFLLGLIMAVFFLPFKCQFLVQAFPVHLFKNRISPSYSFFFYVTCFTFSWTSKVQPWPVSSSPILAILGSFKQQCISKFRSSWFFKNHWILFA